MFALKSLAVALVLPPTLLVLVAGAGLLIHRRQPRLGRAATAAGLLLIVLLSMPWVADTLRRSLETYGPIPPEGVRQAQAIVVLGGGTYHNAPEFGGADTVSVGGLARIRYGAHLHRQSGLPLLVAGGAPREGRSEAEVMRDALEGDFRVVVRWIEMRSVSTEENALFSSDILANGGVSAILLVTDAMHMARAKLAFERRGIVVLPAPTGFATDSHEFDYFLPSAQALSSSAGAMREWLALSLARLR